MIGQTHQHCAHCRAEWADVMLTSAAMATRIEMIRRDVLRRIEQQHGVAPVPVEAPTPAA